jgi:hypothetical protein
MSIKNQSLEQPNTSIYQARIDKEFSQLEIILGQSNQ